MSTNTTFQPHSWRVLIRKVPIIPVLTAMLVMGSTVTTLSKEKPSSHTFVSILPQAYFVERVGSPHVDVTILVGPGRSPATYEPTPHQMAMLAAADLYFRIGVPFEQAFLHKLSSTFPRLQIVDTRQGVPLRFFDRGHAHAEGSHYPGETSDPHIWLDPKRVKIQASTICAALKKKDPVYAGVFETNLQQFVVDLDAIDKDVSRILAPVRGSDMFVFHPAFGYFCESYGLNQIALEVAGKEPTAKHVATLIDTARQKGARVIFVEPQFSKKAAETVARAIGGRVEFLDPLARNWSENIRQMALIIRQALEKQ